MGKREFKENIEEKIKQITEKPLLTSVIVLVILTILVLGLSLPYYFDNFRDFFKEVLAEAHGMLFDIAIIGILIYWLRENGEKQLRIKMYKDEIDDFRQWESEEAAFRTVGNIKRLNRHKITEINLVNCHLTKTNMSHVELTGSNLNSSNFSHANAIECNFSATRANQTNFENAKMNQANFEGAFASGANFKDAFLIKANFKNAFLIKSDFSNAYLMEADLSNCHLTGAVFDEASLYKANLRGAEGITVDQLKKVKTLYLAELDDDIKSEIQESYPELLGK
ncbi:pentapeptide repeat-containing protein [Marivirga harenae]|uniref:pentapeptide repeat-containing protein n=1 Tax=Marivirga harenae TaxID=2010992 RepID=UPI0026DF87E2|nr:pentapeptide repeat-containing protein [Marivirga harenae]WKV10662.1 pentapeptide repeat-containing protein [Marivirga harenae]|tara:strand:- start:46930 stop:47772 length:843 start_codon:yes stop_codon:yes gene_type:complete